MPALWREMVCFHKDKPSYNPNVAVWVSSYITLLCLGHWEVQSHRGEQWDIQSWYPEPLKTCRRRAAIQPSLDDPSLCVCWLRLREDEMSWGMCLWWRWLKLWDIVCGRGNQIGLVWELVFLLHSSGSHIKNVLPSVYSRGRDRARTIVVFYFCCLCLL